MNRRNFLSSSAKVVLITTGLIVSGNLLTACSADDDSGYYDDDGYYNGDGYYDDDGYYGDGYYDDRQSKSQM